MWRNRSLFTETAWRRNESTSDPFHSLAACLVISYYRPEKINARQQEQFISIKITTGTLSTKINIIYKGVVAILGLVLRISANGLPTPTLARVTLLQGFGLVGIVTPSTDAFFVAFVGREFDLLLNSVSAL